MIQGSSRRTLRRITAGLAGTAVAAATVGLAAPANAAESAVGGIVTDAAGNPVWGTVLAYEQGADGDEFADGYLDLDNGAISGTLPDGVYKLKAMSGDYSEFYLDKADLASADAVNVTGGAVGLAAWVLEKPYVTATVTDAAGRPVSGVEVTAFDAADQTNEVATDYSDEDGKVVLPVSAGPVKLHADTRFSNTAGHLSSEWFDNKADFASADAVTPTPYGTPAVVIGLNAGAAMTGQVLSDAGVPLEQVQVSAASDSDFGSDLTDKNGVFVIEGLEAGHYTVEFEDSRIGEYVSEYWNNAKTSAEATKVSVGVDGFVGGLNASLTPRTPEPLGSLELSGVVTDDTGAPVAAALVQVTTTATSPFKKDGVAYDYTNRAGIYAFDELDGLSGKNVKVSASPPQPGDEDGYGLFWQWFGQHTSYDRATPVLIGAGASARADIALPRSGGIAGSVRGVAGKGIDGSVSVLSVDGDVAGSVGTKADDTFELRSLYPGTYKVQFSDNAGNHVPEWWKNDNFEGAKTITVKSGETVTGLDAVLDASLSATQRPTIKGYPWVGKSIKVDSGEWSYETGTQYSYEWLIGNQIVGTGASYTPTKKQIGDKLQVRVLAENGRLAGIATTAKSAKIGYKSKIKAKIRGDRAFITIKAQKIKGKKVKGKITVKEIVRVKDDGTIKYKKIGKTKIKKAKGTVSLKKLKKGKHKIVFFFKGKGKVGSSELTKKVKTKR